MERNPESLPDIEEQLDNFIWDEYLGQHGTF